MDIDNITLQKVIKNFFENSQAVWCMGGAGGDKKWMWSELNNRLLYPRDQMFMGSTGSKTDDLVHVVTRDNFMVDPQKEREKLS